MFIVKQLLSLSQGTLPEIIEVDSLLARTTTERPLPCDAQASYSAFFKPRIYVGKQSFQQIYAIGDDRNLATHGHNPFYWYSFTDFYILIRNIRQRLFNYNHTDGSYIIKDDKGYDNMSGCCWDDFVIEFGRTRI